MCRKLSWWNLRRGAKLRGPKTYRQDGNHGTRKAKALGPPQDEVTSWLRRKTKQKPYACTRRTGVTCRNGTTRWSLCCVCCALLCSLCAVLSCPPQCTMSSVPFSRPPTNAPTRLKHDEIKTRGIADGFRGGGALVSPGVHNCAKGTHREAPTASIHGHGDASVFGPNDADRRGAPVAWDTGFFE